MTGLINFTQDGLRNSFNIDVIELKRYWDEDLPYEIIANYQCPYREKKNKTLIHCDSKDTKDDTKDYVMYKRNYTVGEEIVTDISEREFTVYMRIGEPYLRLE